jgi:sensor c-di-GMP phosphodiesterase-like protein
MARGLNLSVTAEGVETEEQLAFLRSLSCDLAQGFHFGRPMPAVDFAALLRAGPAMHARRDGDGAREATEQNVPLGGLAMSRA